MAQTYIGGYFFRLVFTILGNSVIKQGPFKVNADLPWAQAWVLGTGTHLLMSMSREASFTPKLWGLGTPLSSGALFKERMSPGRVEIEVTPHGARWVRLVLPSSPGEFWSIF